MQDGIHTDLTIEDYHNNKTHLSSTLVRMAKRSLKEMQWYREGKIRQEQKSHFDFGNAFELALLDRNMFAEKVAIIKDSEWVGEAMAANPKLERPRNSKVYQERSQEFYDNNKGKYLIGDKGKESWETIESMLESCYQDKVIQGLIRNTEYQVSLFWTDVETGLRLKTRPDICKRKKNVVVNVKTTADGSPKAFSKELVNYDYPIQACMEITGCLQTGLMETIDSYFWLVVEKEPPFNATIYEFTQEDIHHTMDEMKYLFNKIWRAQEEKLFPGYSDRSDNQYGILKAEIPLYYKSF
jgi:hypothetical protein